MQPTTTEPKLSYADALSEANDWAVEWSKDLSAVPQFILSFIAWYAHSARRYTVDSAFSFWYAYEPRARQLVYREGEREVPSPDVRGEGVLHSPDEQGRETVPAPPSHSIPKGVILYGG